VTAGIMAYSQLKALAVNGAGHPADVGRIKVKECHTPEGAYRLGAHSLS